jgi:hypothetical protein
MTGSAVSRRDDPLPGSAEESLKDALGQTLDEARMVLPGVQALFGFQLIAVFSDGFEQRLSGFERDLHLVAVVLVTIAIALLMTPAAYHRQVDRRRATAEFLAMASRLISGAMLPLAAGLALDIQIVARVVTGELVLATAIGIAVFAMFVVLWFVFPQWRAARKQTAKR